MTLIMANSHTLVVSPHVTGIRRTSELFTYGKIRLVVVVVDDKPTSYQSLRSSFATHVSAENLGSTGKTAEVYRTYHPSLVLSAAHSY